MNASERNNYMYWELLHVLADLESNTFREHWLYRATMFGINTNMAVNPIRRWEYEHLMGRAREYMEEMNT